MGAPTRERLNELFNDEGFTVRRRVNRSNAKAGSVIRNVGSHGYYRVRVDGKYYLVHRILWCMRYGQWPTGDIDHIDRNPLNNCTSNLREATHQQNMCNTAMQKNNTSGHRGVSWHKAAGKWIVQLNAGGQSIYGGLHECKQAAIVKYIELQNKYHMEFSGEVGYR